MKKIKMGILGFGFMGHNHGKNIQSFDELELIAVCDINPKQLADAPEGILIYEDVDEFLKADMEVVIISVPNPIHYLMVEKCANAGKDIICEKPAAMNVVEYDKMLEITEKKGVRFTVHQQRRWDYDYRIMKEVFQQQLVGKPYIIKSQLYGVNGNMHDWHIYPEMGGGMLYDWGIHLIDQILTMVPSKVVSLYAIINNVINEKVDDYFKIIISFDNDLTAEIELGTYYLTPKRAWFIGGTTGSAVIDNFKGEGQIVRTHHLLENVPGEITMTAAGPTRSFGPPEEGLLYEDPLPEVERMNSEKFYLRNYIDAYLGNMEFEVKADEVRRDLVFMEAVRKSAATKEAVRFEV